LITLARRNSTSPRAADLGEGRPSRCGRNEGPEQFLRLGVAQAAEAVAVLDVDDVVADVVRRLDQEGQRVRRQMA